MSTARAPALTARNRLRLLAKLDLDAVGLELRRATRARVVSAEMLMRHRAGGASTASRWGVHLAGLHNLVLHPDPLHDGIPGGSSENFDLKKI